MTGRVAKYAVLDTGFWLGLFDPTDAHHATARELYEKVIEPLHVIAPWPCLYEFLGTRFVRRAPQVAALESAMRRPGVHHLDDRLYRSAALALCLDPRSRARPLSLVDRVVRAMVEDVGNRVDAIVTVDPNDFRDVCMRRRVELIALN